jgi:uncharacterized protein YuzE
MKIKYDKTVDALYIELAKAKAHKSVEKGDNVVVDFNRRGKAIGIEILNYSNIVSRGRGFEILAGQKKIPITA